MREWGGGGRESGNGELDTRDRSQILSGIIADLEDLNSGGREAQLLRDETIPCRAEGCAASPADGLCAGKTCAGISSSEEGELLLCRRALRGGGAGGLQEGVAGGQGGDGTGEGVQVEGGGGGEAVSGMDDLICR